MINLGKTIDKLIEISTTSKLPDDCRLKLNVVIEELIHFYFESNGGHFHKLVEAGDIGDGPVPDFRDLSPEEMEEVKEFEMMVRTILDENVAMA